MTSLTLLTSRESTPPELRRVLDHVANAATILECAVEDARPLTWDETVAVRARLALALERP